MAARTISAVLIDFDGTLVDSEPKHCKAHQQLLASRGIELDEARIYGNIGKSDRAFYLDIMSRFNCPGDVDAWMRAKTDLLLDIYRDEGLQLRPGVRELLEHAHGEGLCCCIVTSTERRVATMALELIGLAQRLPIRVCYEDVTARKPDPAPYLLAARRLSVPPEACLVIEDSVSGVRSGFAAGAIVIGMLGHSTSEDLMQAGATRCVRSLAEIIPVNQASGHTTSLRRATRV
jgi:HAD superfamily hydrolase (TIGR01509 family)